MRSWYIFFVFFTFIISYILDYYYPPKNSTYIKLPIVNENNIIKKSSKINSKTNKNRNLQYLFSIGILCLINFKTNIEIINDKKKIVAMEISAPTGLWAQRTNGNNIKEYVRIYFLFKCYVFVLYL